MATATVWKNVSVAMQSAIATAKTISGITQANPAVITSTSHGYSNGDIVYLEVQGMWQMNEKAVRVANVTTNTFEAEGVDASAFEAFTSGTAKKVTMGTSITSATSISTSGGDFDRIDTTTIHGNAKTEVPGLPSPISFSMDHIWDSTDSGQAAMKAASDVQAKRVFKFQFGSGGKVLYFVGYVGFNGLPGGQGQGLVTCQAVITMNGTPTFYAS
jgi:hypothetical protein